MPVDAGVLLGANAVFEGTVIARRMVLAREHGVFFPVPEYEFRVTRAWKGVSSPTIRLLGGFSNCATVFRKGVPYVVVASPHSEQPARLSSSKCGPTVPVEEAGAHLAILGRPAVVFARGDERRSATLERLRSLTVGGLSVFGNLLWNGSDGWSWMSWPAALLAVFAVAALVLAVFSIRRRRRAAVLIIVSILLAVASLLAAGMDLYRDSYFTVYLE